MGAGRADIESDDMNLPDIPEEEKERLLHLIRRMMEMGMGAVYGQEDEGLPDADVDCEANLKSCRAKCCTFQFALTKDEVKKGIFKHNQSRPFFIARDADGYCPHLERGSLKCAVWSERPIRCRRYACNEDRQLQ